MADTLLTGKPYTSSAETDLRKTFARIRREMKQAEQQRKESLEKIIKMPVYKVK